MGNFFKRLKLFFGKKHELRRAARIDNYYDFKVNEEGPLGKKIKAIIIRAEKIIVYLDEEDVIQWSKKDDVIIDLNSFGNIQNNISMWESISNKLFSKKDSFSYKCLLAEAYARILNDNNTDTANAIISNTKDRIKKHGREVLKQVYLLSTFISTCLIILAIIGCIWAKPVLMQFVTHNSYQIILTTLFGGIGAFVFSVLRLKDYTPDIAISKKIHIIDGALRVFYGLISGLIIALGIKSNIVLGFVNQMELTIYLSAFLGIMAGASDLIIPNLIKQVETRTQE